MAAQLARPVVRNARHTTTIDIAVLSFMVQIAGSEIEGIHEAQLTKADLLREATNESSTDAGQPNQQLTAFDERAEIVLHLKLIPFMNAAVPPIITALRNRVIERIQSLTDLKVHAVHIHVASMQMG